MRKANTVKELEDLIENHIDYFRPGYILTDREEKVMNIKEIEKEISTLNDTKKDLEDKILQLERQLEDKQKDSLKCLVGLAFWNDEDNQGFIVIDTPRLYIKTLRDTHINPYSIPILYFNGKDMKLMVGSVNSTAIDKEEDAAESFIKEREASNYRQIPVYSFIERIYMLLCEYIEKVAFGDKSRDMTEHE
jgi:hypothetical protein